MRLLLIDNYDSFTYNLVQRVGEIAPSIAMHVARNDQITLDDAERWQPTHLMVSPGPCTPKQAGVSGELVRHFHNRIAILGVCLGHQSIADTYGLTVRRHHVLMHGKTSQIHHTGEDIFEGLDNPFTATRYHSLIVDRDSIDDRFAITAWTDDDEVMALKWVGRGADTTAAPMHGVQFHPESFLTIEGPKLLANFLGVARPSAAGMWYDAGV